MADSSGPPEFPLHVLSEYALPLGDIPAQLDVEEPAQHMWMSWVRFKGREQPVDTRKLRNNVKNHL